MGTYELKEAKCFLQEKLSIYNSSVLGGLE